MVLYVYFAVCCIITAVGFCVYLYYQFRCRHKDSCSNRSCRFTEYCKKYKDVLTQEEIERLQKMVDELGD